MTVLALATLGDMTQIGSFLLAKVSIYGTISQHNHVQYCAKLRQCKLEFMERAKNKSSQLINFKSRIYLEMENHFVKKKLPTNYIFTSLGKQITTTKVSNRFLMFCEFEKSLSFEGAGSSCSVSA